MNQFLYPEEEIPDKEVTIIKNGEKNLKKGINIVLHNKLNLEDLAYICKRKLKFQNIQNFRIFTQDGVELFDEDLRYIPFNSTLYASEGDEYDSSSQFAQYKKIKVIGQGGFGKVVLGEHRITKQKVAIKYVQTNVSNGADLDQVYKEAEIMKNMQHKNIVEIHHTYTLKNMQTVFIMEYLEGGELLDLLESKGRIQEEEAREYFSQMIDAIHYCHNEKLIHRDLKLENIMLYRKDSKQIKIVDFGISGVSNNFKLDNIAIGSLKYMAPEVLGNKIDKIGPSIDIWALGVILYAMVCGQLPFDGPNSKIVSQKIIQGIYSFPPDLENSLSIEFRSLINDIFITSVQNRATLKDIKEHPWMEMDLSKVSIDQSNKQYNKKYGKQINALRSGQTGMYQNSLNGISGIQTIQSQSQQSTQKVSINNNSSQVSHQSSKNNSQQLPSIQQKQSHQDLINNKKPQFNIKTSNTTGAQIKVVKYDKNNKLQSQTQNQPSIRQNQRSILTNQQRQARSNSPTKMQRQSYYKPDLRELQEEDGENERMERTFTNFTNLSPKDIQNVKEGKNQNSQKSIKYIIKKFNLNPIYIQPVQTKKARSFSPMQRRNHQQIAQFSIKKISNKPPYY